MSKVSKFGFSNTTASTKVETPIAVGVTTNYALKQDEPTVVDLDNKTCPFGIVTGKQIGRAHV